MRGTTTPRSLFRSRKEETQLKQRVEASGSQQLGNGLAYELTGLFFGGGIAATGSASYDMCRSCVSGLLKARLATNKQIREALGLVKP